jgi:hypothetical protein
VALEGNLNDFSLGDMLRLLSSGAKTGVLHVATPTADGLVCLKDGRISYASADAGSESVSQRLARAGIVAQKQLRQAQGLMKIQRKDKAKRLLGQILVDEGYVDARALDGFVSELIGEALFEMLRWTQGDLRFDADESCQELDLGLSVPVETLLEQAGERLRTWERVLEAIGSVDTRFVMSEHPGDRTAEIHLKPREWMLLCYLHTGRSVLELAEMTGYGEFETATILADMQAEGLVERVSPAGTRAI